MSRRLGSPKRFKSKREFKVLFDMGDVVWDFVAIYAPGTRWRSGRARLEFGCGAVVKVVEEIRAALRRTTRRP